MNDFLDNLNASLMAKAVGGQLEGNPAAPIERARVDSRSCRTGDLFIAIKGASVDGNTFAEDAWSNGAEVVLGNASASIPPPPEGKALVRVSCPLEALQKLAEARRNAAKNLDVVGITGSNGKTTSKNVLAAIVEDWMGPKVLVTAGNYNSEIGLPLTLIGLRSWHRMAIFEMGTNRAGEIALLTHIAKPRIALITNIGTAHIGMENLGSIDAIAREKRAIFSNAAFESVAIVGLHEPWANFLVESFPGMVCRFGDLTRQGWEKCEDRGIEGFCLERGGKRVRYRLPGHHNLLNAMAAVEAGIALGAPESSIISGLENVRPAFGRSEIIRGNVTVIRDYYNANLESSIAALDMLRDIPVNGRRIVVFGVLRELGKETEKIYRTIGEKITQSKVDAVFLLGEELSVIAQTLSNAQYNGIVHQFSDMDELKLSLTDYCGHEDMVLLKGSRGSALERLNSVFTDSEVA